MFEISVWKLENSSHGKYKESPRIKILQTYN